jgi:3-hydroxyisobutyrate dehydrogenase-like beta-hydroxyacid dehydrogenase
MTDKPRIGFIGLGIMGLAMAKNAARAGYQVVAFNRSEAGRNVAREAGIAVLPAAADVGMSSDAIITMVTGPAAIRELAAAPKGFLNASGAGKTWIQMSTIDEASTLDFAAQAGKKGFEFLDCPVTGSKKQVEEAQLILLAGGEAALVEKWRPFLMSIGKAVVHAGEVGKGTALKLCMNLIVAEMTTALCESVALARSQGLSPERIFDVISESPALNCGYFQIKKSALLRNDFSPAFSLDNMLKDVRFMDDAAGGRGLSLPVIKAVRSLMERAAADGLGKEDLSSIAKSL